MTDQEAYRRYTAKAEELLTEAETAANGLTPEQVTAYGRLAGAWATLALAAAQERVVPRNRPLNGNPETVRDGEGDLWTYQEEDGKYTTPGSLGERATLAEIARKYGGYTEVT